MGKILSFVDNIIPKSKHVWAFPVCYLNHCLFDNPRAVFEEVRDDPDLKKIVLYRSKIAPSLNGENIRVIKLRSIAGFFWLCRSHVVFVRHCIAQDIEYPLVNSKHLVVNLWHGIALKKIGIQGVPDSITGCDPLGAIISSSATDKEVMVSSFTYANHENTWITGLPRNDLLFKERSQLWQEAIDELERIEASLAGRKLILFAPTFRAGWEGWDEKNGFYKFSESELEQLARIAADSGAVLGVRTHLREERSVLDAFKNLDVLVFNDIIETAILLRKTDILISDYSSIAIDFMLTQRPVLSFAFDYDSYKNGRGLLYNLEEVFASPLCYNFETLKLALIDALDRSSSDQISKRYSDSLNHFHNYVDDQSSNRVIQNIYRTIGAH